ncbi:uncharacterized protein LOC144152613 [Haemaphysalis longicornis]
MLGFRAKLGTKDAMLLLQREVLEPPGGLPKKDNRAILGLDLQSAFDKVRHSAILAQASRLGLGRRSYEYIRSFLSRRTARLEVGGAKLEERELGSVGTPQGSVISPLLFNLVMIEVARRLEELGPAIKYCIYADDVTIWATGGSDGDVEAGLQSAVDAVEAALSGTGLRCSPQKSQLLILPPPGRWRKRAAEEAERTIVVRAGDGAPIPHVSGLRVLGMFVDAHRTNGTAVKHIVTKMGIATRLVKRVSSRSRGMREASLLRLLQAFVVSHAAYAGAFHRWTKGERQRIDAAIRKAYTGALGLLNGTKTSALLSLGVHNTLSEISEAQRASQLARLGSTAVGRRILARAGLQPPDTGGCGGPTASSAAGGVSEADELVPLRDEIARSLIVYPLPRNVDPERDAGRRAARARALAHQYSEDDGAVFVDAAKCRGRPCTFVAVAARASTGELLTAGSVCARSASQAEEAAIALALGLPGVRTVLSDSKTAIRNFARGVVCGGTARLLESWRTTGAAAQGVTKTTIIKWFPAHAGRELAPGLCNRNEEADAAARGLATCRVATSRPLSSSLEDCGETTDIDDDEEAEPLTDYGGVLRWHRDQRRAFPLPHRDLSRAEAVKLRQLQTETVLTPALARHVCPDLYESARCSVCERETATLTHIMWGCDCAVRDGGGDRQDPQDPYPPDVRECVGSAEPQQQRRAIQRLEAALALQRRKGAPRPPVPPGTPPSHAGGGGRGPTVAAGSAPSSSSGRRDQPPRGLSPTP